MSQTFYKKGFLALAVATALGVSAFAQADIKIGVAGPMTGANAAFGEQYMKGAQAAADAVATEGCTPHTGKDGPDQRGQRHSQQG